MKALLVLCMWLGASTALAAPIRAEDFTDREHLTLSKAMVLETGWDGGREQMAVAYVLVKRWKVRVSQYDNFSGLIVAYCRGMHQVNTRRRQWISELNLEGTRPPSFPRKLSWRNHQRIWFKILKRMKGWSQGKYRDPYKGKAWHWRSPTDPPTNAVLLEPQLFPNGNIYYGKRKRRK